MTKELNCVGCGGRATLTKTLPMCARCGLAVAEEAMAFVFAGLRGDAGVIELPSAPAPRMSPADADDVAHQHLAALRRGGAKRVTFRDFKGLMEITGRSRPWVYRWLDDQVKDGSLTKDTKADPVAYAFTS